MIDAFKIQAHAMFLDTSLNSVATVLFNICTAFLETANKMWTYAKCLPVGKQPSTILVISKSIESVYLILNKAGKKLMRRNIETIKSLSDLAFVLSKSKGRNKKNEGYKCAISKVQIEWYDLSYFIVFVWANDDQRKILIGV